VNKVEIFCFRTGSWQGYYGFGLTPQAAKEAARKAGARAEDVKKGRMVKLPEGVTEYGISEFGHVQWRGPETPEFEALTVTVYAYDKASDEWKPVVKAAS
jgi:hypothetical protein